MESVQAVILAAGEGTRLRPLTRNRPKVMLPIGNRPILAYVLDAVVACGIRDITVVVGYRKEQVMTYLNTYPVSVNVVVQNRQLGTAHALFCAKDFIHTKTIVLPGDDYIDASSIRLMMARENAVLVSPHPKPANFGVISQHDGLLSGIIEKPSRVEPGALVSCGVYTFSPELLHSIDVGTLPEFLKILLERGHALYAVRAADWHDAVFPWDLLHLNDHVLQDRASVISGTLDRSVVIRGRVVIGKGTVVGPGTVLTGPVVIGENCTIGPNVVIGPGTSIGRRVSVEPFAYISHSIVMWDCSVGSHSRIVDAVIGEGCHVADHLSTVTSQALCRTPEDLVYVSNPFGAILGDRVVTGPFTVVRSAVVGNNVAISGNTSVDREIPDDARVM